MNYISSDLYVFIEKALAEGKEPDADGYYIFTKMELLDGAGVTASSLNKKMDEVVRMLTEENKGWFPDNDDAIDMISDISFERGVLKFRRNPEAMDLALDYYWAPHPTYSYFTYRSYDEKHRRRDNSSKATYGTFPWSWTEEQVDSAYIEWINRPKEKGTYAYSEREKRSPEEERIASIRANGGCHLKNFNTENRTYKMCLTAVELDGEALEYVPETFRTKEVYEAAVKRTGSMLSRIPEAFITKEMCEDAVSSEGLALEYVPDKFKTADVCLLAAIQNPLALQRMPEKYITVDFVVELIKKYPKETEAVVSLPKSFKNAKFYLSLIEVCPEVIWKIPKSAHTVAISKACLRAMKCKTLADAVKTNPEFLSQVHPSLYDYEACLAFVKSEFFTEGVQKRDNIGPYSGFRNDSDCEKGLFYMNRRYDSPYSIPHMARWHDVCLALVTGNADFIKYVKPEILTSEICARAVETSQYGLILEDIPMEFKSRDLCMLAFEKDTYNIKFFPDEYITDELVLRAVKRSGFILEYIADKYKTREVCLIAVSDKRGGKLEYVPESIIDKEICLAWINGLQMVVCPLDYIPKKLWDYDICYTCVSKYGFSLKKVPSELIDEPMCLAAVKSHFISAKYIPENLFTTEMAEIITEHSCGNFGDIPTKFLTEKACSFFISLYF